MSIIEEALRKVDHQTSPISAQTIKPGKPNPKILFIIAAIFIFAAIVWAIIKPLHHTITIEDDGTTMVSPFILSSSIKQPIPNHENLPVLNGIVSGAGEEPVAIINNLIMKKGDTRYGITVIDIQKDRVKILYGEKETILNLEQ